LSLEKKTKKQKKQKTKKNCSFGSRKQNFQELDLSLKKKKEKKGG
jgi:hypothetical protein